MDNPSQILTWKRIWLILILIAIIWLLLSARAALVPLAASFILAYLLQPLVDRLETWKIPRPLAVLIPLLGLGVLLVILWVSISPVVQEQITAFAKKLPGHITVIQSWLIATLDRFQLPQTAELKNYFTENLSLLGQLPVSALKTGGSFLLKTTSGLFSIAIGMIYIILIPVMTFYFLRDWKQDIGGVFRLRSPRLPQRGGEKGFPARRASRLVHQGSVADRLHPLRLVCAGLFHRGYAVVAGAGASSRGYPACSPTWNGLSPCRSPCCSPLSRIRTGSTRWRRWPVFGVISPAAGVFLVPRILGNRIGLHPVVVLASIMIGGELMGFAGSLLAVPLAAAIKVGIEAISDYYLK